MNYINNSIYFGANLNTHVSLNQKRWTQIGKKFAEQTNDIEQGKFHIIQSTNKSANRIVYYLATKMVNGKVRAEDAKLIPNEVLGKWLVSLTDDEIAKKLAKIYQILKIRKQAIYNIRKTLDNEPVEKENIATKYMTRVLRFSNNDEDIIMPKHKVDTSKISVWDGIFDVKSDLYGLQSFEDGHRIVATV